MKKIDFKKVYFYLFVVFAFTMPLSRAMISFLSILLPLVWIVEGDFRRKYNQIIANKVLLAIVVFVLYSLLSFFFSENLEEALKIVRLNGYLFTLLVIATSVEKRFIKTILSAFLLGMFVSEVIAYGVFFGVWHFSHASVYNPSPFMFHIDYSVFLAFTSILLLYRVFSHKYSIKNRIIFGAFFLTVTGNLFLSIGRTGQVAYIFAIIVMSILHYRVSLKTFFVSIFLIISILFSAYSLSNSFDIRVKQARSDIENIVFKQDFNNSWGIRVAFWIVGSDIVKNHPFGVGLGDYKDVIKEKLEDKKYKYLTKVKSFMSHNHPHNQYLLILLQMGFVGLALFLNIFYQIVKLKIDDKELKHISILFVTIYMISCMAEPLLLKQFTIALFVLFMGLFSSFGF